MWYLGIRFIINFFFHWWVGCVFIHTAMYNQPYGIELIISSSVLILCFNFHRNWINHTIILGNRRDCFVFSLAIPLSCSRFGIDRVWWKESSLWKTKGCYYQVHHMKPKWKEYNIIFQTFSVSSDHCKGAAFLSTFTSKICWSKAFS
jgi:hypothetical protein